VSLRQVLLVYLGTQAASGYDIVKGFQDTYGYLWHASYQQVYRDLAKLHDDGLIDLELVESASRPPRKVYRLNPTGRTAMRQWLAKPVKPPKFNDAFLVKLASIHLMDREDFLREFDQHRDDYRRTLAELLRVEEVFLTVPPDVLEKFEGVHLTLRYGIRQLETWLDWAQSVETFLQKGRWLRITPTDAAEFTRTIQSGSATTRTTPPHG
jgi:PadR family transcriptional regulator AphA